MPKPKRQHFVSSIRLQLRYLLVEWHVYVRLLHSATFYSALIYEAWASKFRQNDRLLMLILPFLLCVGKITFLISLEKEHLGDALIRIDLRW